MATGDKWNMSSSQAHNYIVDPLLAPDPSDETGLNASFRSTFAAQPTSISPPPALSNTLPSESASLPNKRHSRGPPSSPPAASGTRSRGNSLSQRYPGDMTHRPLDMIKQDSKAAHKSHHLRKRSIPGVDTIDSLDSTPGGQYHHEGPFDATLAARNVNAKYSPIAAVAESNRQALEATPAENIKDAVDRHRPLEGVATVPPGQQDRYGRTYDYEETNLMTEAGGDYKKFPGDALNREQEKELEAQRRYEMGSPSNGEASGIEMKEHGRPKTSVEIKEGEFDDGEHKDKRSSFDGLKKKIGSLRRRKE